MRAIERELPDQSFLYLGDHGHAPYGNQSPEQIYSLTLEALEILFARGCSLVIMACNTAAATGLRQLQQTWLPARYPNQRVIGVLVPVVEAITGVPWIATAMASLTAADVKPARVAIFATAHTVRTRAYVTEISQRAPHIRVSQRPCPDLVDLIESDAPRITIREAVRRHVGELFAADGIPDVCILGCTHYPLIEDHFLAHLPAGVKLFSQPDVTARSLSSYLDRHPRFRSMGSPQSRFLTTGDAARVSALATRFYGCPVGFTSVARAGVAVVNSSYNSTS